MRNWVHKIVMLLLRAMNHASMPCFQGPIAREDALQFRRERYEAGLAGKARGRPILSPIMPVLTVPCILELKYNRRNVVESNGQRTYTCCVGGNEMHLAAEAVPCKGAGLQRREAFE